MKLGAAPQHYSTMKPFRIYCGQRPQDGCYSELLLQQNGLKARKLAGEFFPLGHTVIEATGQWAHADRIIQEPTTIIEVFAENGKAVYEMAGAYKEATNQESVMVLQSEVDADFV